MKEHKKHEDLLLDGQQSRENRPTSPHTVSSPPNGRNALNFLAVPGPRSRGSSFDSMTDNGGSVSSGTYIVSSFGETLRGKQWGEQNPNDMLDDKDALRPDPGTEADFQVEDNKFAFSPGQLGKLYNPKSLGAFRSLRGFEGLEKGLRTDRKISSTLEEAMAPMTSDVQLKPFLDQGPNGGDPTPAAPDKVAFADRKKGISNNQLARRKPQGILRLAWVAYNDKTLILLTVALVISLALGLYRTFGIEPESKILRVEWAEGVVILIALSIVTAPEGLPFVVTSASAFVITRMLRGNSLVRHLRQCETMGNAATICSDKTGTLTQNESAVVSGTLGATLSFSDKKPEVPTTAPLESTSDVSPSEFISTLNEEVKNVLLQSIAQNTTAFEGEQDGHRIFIGSKVEVALLGFARDYLSMSSLSTEQSHANVVQIVPYNSNKCNAVVVKLDNSRYRMHVKGASEILLGKSVSMVSDATKEFVEAPICADNREALKQVITSYASRSLRTIGLAYRDFECWPPKEFHRDEDDPTQAVFEDVFKGMVFLAAIGIQDPLRKCVPGAVKYCQDAGVCVCMVTGDNLLTAKAIAKEHSILVTDGIVMEGPTFRSLLTRDMDSIISKLCVLARSSSEDKRILVQRLKELDKIIAVTGDGTNDAPALKTADIGFSMGIAGTEVAQEVSDIILMDDNFASIMKALCQHHPINNIINKVTKGLLGFGLVVKLLTTIPDLATSGSSSTLLSVWSSSRSTFG